MLCVDAITFAYKGGGLTFGPFGFDANDGHVWAVLGANGAGKSTLFRLLTGELTPRSGTLHRTGTVELIPQGLSIPGRLTVRQAFDYLALLRGVPAASRPDAVTQAIRAVNLEAQADAPLRKLSGGQQRRAVVGQALVASPAILLMDEPSVGLDLDQRATLRQTVARLGEDRLVMVSSHIVEDLAGVADHVLHIVQGRVAFAGPCATYLQIIGDAAGAENSVEAWTAAYRAWNERGTGSTP